MTEELLNKPIPAPVEEGAPAPDTVESGEAIIDITEGFPRMAYAASYLKAGIPDALDRCYVRRGILERLQKALSMLPNDYSFLFYDTLRPVTVQKALFDEYLGRIQKKHPEWPLEKQEEETTEFVARPIVDYKRPSSHQTGGAVDLTLCYQGKELDMGTGFDDFREVAHTDYFEREGMDEEIRKNRRLLYNVMRAVGFENYECEWWHYDYGDMSWARKNQCTPIYSYIEPERKA